MQPLGPQGVQQRIAEIRKRIEEAVGRPVNSDGAMDFPGALQGQIGGEGSFRPLNPFGDGTSVSANQTPNSLAPMIQRAATEAGVDPALFDALVASESSYDPSARSSAGALGLSQLMPDTARALGVANPLDPMQNLRGGAAYLSQMIQRFNGDARLALAAYNAGPGAVEKYGGIPPYEETRRYVDKVLNLYQARKGS